MFQNEKIVETKTCKHCRISFYITDKDLEFYEKVSPVFSSPSPLNIPLDGGGTKGGVLNLGNEKIKYLIPTPTLCPDCRQQRRLSWKNERKLYRDLGNIQQKQTKKGFSGKNHFFGGKNIVFLGIVSIFRENHQF